MTKDTPSLADELEEKRRRGLTHHEQMLDAQSKCVPCGLCGGQAVITDAGCGAGYYIACKNYTKLRADQGCLISDRRLGGWAYNVMEWWNRLMDTRPTEARTGGDALREAAKAIVARRDLAVRAGFPGHSGIEPGMIDALERALSHPTPADDAGTPDDVVEAAAKIAENYANATGRVTSIRAKAGTAIAYRIRAQLPLKIAALTASGDARERALPTDAQVSEAMQTAWDDFCADAQAHPDDIYREGGKTFFRAGTWARHTAMELRALLDTHPAGDGGGV